MIKKYIENTILTLAAPEFEFKRVIFEKKIIFMWLFVPVCLTSRSGVVGSWERETDRQTGTRQRQTEIGSKRRGRGRDRQMHDLGNGIIPVTSLFTTPAFMSGDL